METLVKKFKKNGTAELFRKMEKLSVDEKLACIEVLKQRNQDVSKWEVKTKQELKVEEIVFQDETPLTEEEKEILNTFESEEKLVPIEPISVVKIEEAGKPSISKKSIENTVKSIVNKELKSKTLTGFTGDEIFELGSRVSFNISGKEKIGEIKRFFIDQDGKEKCRIKDADNKIFFKGVKAIKAI